MSDAPSPGSMLPGSVIEALYELLENGQQFIALPGRHAEWFLLYSSEARVH